MYTWYAEDDAPKVKPAGKLWRLNELRSKRGPGLGGSARVTTDLNVLLTINVLHANDAMLCDIER